MPIFEFECDHCGHVFEDIFKMSDEVEEVDCPKCEHEKSAKKLISKSSFRSTGDNIKSFSRHRNS